LRRGVDLGFDGRDEDSGMDDDFFWGMWIEYGPDGRAGRASGSKKGIGQLTGPPVAIR
jgi:hypothetical protein